MPKLEVTPEMHSEVTALVARHSSGLKPKALQILANYAIFTLANEDTAEGRAKAIAAIEAKAKELTGN